MSVKGGFVFAVKFLYKRAHDKNVDFFVKVCETARSDLLGKTARKSDVSTRHCFTKDILPFLVLAQVCLQKSHCVLLFRTLHHIALTVPCNWLGILAVLLWH